LLISAAADHILNIETTSEVALAGDGWRVVGTGKCLVGDAGPWTLTRQPWQVVIEVIPVTLYFTGEHGAGDYGQSMRSIDITPLSP
jgi:hypothetical protein